jgi:ABC-type branched-subunit amino acid transport system ATPase component
VKLQAEGLSVRFDGVRALEDVTLSAVPGERLGLVGPNGAGKTTLLNAISGLVPVERGCIALLGRRLDRLDAAGVARAGVGRTFQSPRLVPRMTVEENLRAGRRVDAEPWLRWAGLAERRRDLAGSLTLGEARRLELARALGGEPAALLLDEPCGGLTPTETEAMVALLASAAAPPRITLLVEHKLGVVSRLCERTVVLHLGRKIFDGPSRDLHRDPRVLEAYVGRARA